MEIIIMLLFIGAILFVLMKKGNTIEVRDDEDHITKDEDHIDLSRDFAKQIDLVNSQYALGKISKKTRDELVTTINANAVMLFKEHLDAIDNTMTAEMLNEER